METPERVWDFALSLGRKTKMPQPTESARYLCASAIAGPK